MTPPIKEPREPVAARATPSRSAKAFTPAVRPAVSTTLDPVAWQRLMRDATVRGATGTAFLQHLQRSCGNAATVGWIQRQDEAFEEPSLSPQQDDLFVAVMEEMSDEELDQAAEIVLGGTADEAVEESSASEAPIIPTPGEATIQRVEGTIRRAKNTKGTQIASANAPNLTLANKLEQNRSKPRRARLVAHARWRTMKAKHGKLGHRKYAAIRHQNLRGNTSDDDLVLLLRLRSVVATNSQLDLHFSAIEAKANKKRQTAQQRTELLGEAVAAERMRVYVPNAVLLIGFASGPGIDQLWVDRSAKVYYVVEAKGPGASLKNDLWAVKGATGGPLLQMSPQWIANRIPQLAASNKPVLKTLLKDCGLAVQNRTLVSGTTKGQYTLEGLVITANWDEQGGDTKSSISNKQTYTF